MVVAMSAVPWLVAAVSVPVTIIVAGAVASVIFISYVHGVDC